MRKTVVAAFVAATLLSSGILGIQAEAMVPGAPSIIGTADTIVVQKASMGCGYYGCRRVWNCYWYGYYGRGGGCFGPRRGNYGGW
jgi:hypothetical protein